MRNKSKTSSKNKTSSRTRSSSRSGSDKKCVIKFKKCRSSNTKKLLKGKKISRHCVKELEKCKK